MDAVSVEKPSLRNQFSVLIRGLIQERNPVNAMNAGKPFVGSQLTVHQRTHADEKFTSELNVRNFLCKVNFQEFHGAFAAQTCCESKMPIIAVKMNGIFASYIMCDIRIES